MESLAKMIALYLKVMGWFFLLMMTGLFCMSVYMVFQPSAAQRDRIRMHSEQSPSWYLRQ